MRIIIMIAITVFLPAIKGQIPEVSQNFIASLVTFGFSYALLFDILDMVSKFRNKK